MEISGGRHQRYTVIGGMAMYKLSRPDTEIHMEQGPIGKTLLFFTLPVLLSQILQQLYSVADCMVVGHFGGDNGLAAAGVAGLLLSVIVNFFIGFSSGISFITARFFGSYEYARLKRTIQTMIVLAMGLGGALTIAGLAGARTFLLWLNCPEAVLSPAELYLNICFFGMIPQLIYNTGNAILRSLGNTRSPLVYLTFSSCLNLVLDLVLVVGASTGLAGAAWATLISQWLLAALILWKLNRMEEAYCLDFHEKLLSLKEFGEIFRMGIPSGMQAVFMSISSLVIQVSINQFGPDAVGGMTVYARVEGFLYYPAFSYGMALTGFIGQNFGAGRMDRVRQAMRTSLKTAIGFTLPLSLLLMLCSRYILLCFTREPGILFYGQEAIWTIFPWYFLYAVDQVYIGGLKGLGHTGYPMICSMICYCLFRVAWCRILLPVWWDMRVVYHCYNVSLFLMLLLLAVQYYRIYRRMSESGERMSVYERKYSL